MDYLKTISLHIVFGATFYLLSLGLQSNFLPEYLIDNLITVLLALLAINTTTSSVIMTKLREISAENQVDFSLSIRSMKTAVVEQVVLIIIAVFALVFLESPMVNTWWLMPHIITTILIAVFSYAVHVLYDTANGAFIILRHENGGDTEV